MSELDVNAVLISILEMQKQLVRYVDLHHGWTIALADAVKSDPALKERLEQHSFYDRGPQKDLQKIHVLLVNIDALIQQLRHRS